jgi:uncharacterized lipoprotein NlpE involved in copper resistance
MKKLFLFMLVAFSLAGCRNRAESPAEALDSIDNAMESGRYDVAQRACNEIFANQSALDTVSVPTLCRMAIVLTKLADAQDDLYEENTTQALVCYRTAIQRDSLATVTYLRSLPVEEYRNLDMLNQLLRRINDRESGVIYSFDEFEPADSTYEP